MPSAQNWMPSAQYWMPSAQNWIPSAPYLCIYQYNNNNKNNNNNYTRSAMNDFIGASSKFNAVSTKYAASRRTKLTSNTAFFIE
jgi:hypothetical protein